MSAYIYLNGTEHQLHFESHGYKLVANNKEFYFSIATPRIVRSAITYCGLDERYKSYILNHIKRRA